MHQGRAYHEFMLASPGDIRVRRRFQHLVCQFTPYKGTILDFGAGTGIDAKAYAERNFKVLVYEPCEENRSYLANYCRQELECGDIVTTDLATKEPIHMIAADFAVLNLVADHSTLFETFDRLLAPEGYIVVSLLNPYFLGDARYRWWRTNLRALLRYGRYTFQGNDGPVHRLTPNAATLCAQPAFHRSMLRPAGPRMVVSRYMFLVFRKNC